jgi:hypothetical protein
MTVLDAFDLAVCDDAELGRRAAACDGQTRPESIERYVALAQARAALPLVGPTILGESRRYFRDVTFIVPAARAHRAQPPRRERAAEVRRRARA